MLRRMDKYAHVLPQHHGLIQTLRDRLGAPTAQVDVEYVWAKPGDTTTRYFWAMRDGAYVNTSTEPGPPIPTELMVEVPEADWGEVAARTKVAVAGDIAKGFALYLRVPIV